MKYLLDSHVLLWFDGEPDRLSAEVHLILKARASVFVSAATAWELSIKFALKKLQLRVPVSEMASAYGFSELPVTFKHVEHGASLPFHHADPFDRLLIAQASLEGLVLITGDKKLMDYGAPTLLI